MFIVYTTIFWQFLQCVSVGYYAKHSTSYGWHVCLSTCLSRTGIVSKQYKLGPDPHWQIA